MKQVTTLGIDLAKQVFFLVGLDANGKQVWRKKVRRSALMAALAKLNSCLVAMEACTGSHYWAREFQGLGHRVVLLPPQHVKGYLRGQKNDYNDAQAIAEASVHGAIRPVRIKTVEQQEEQALHRLRKELVGSRTRLINQARGLLADHGVVLQQGEGVFRRAVPQLLTEEEPRLSPRFKALLRRQYDQLVALDEELTWYDQQLKQQSKQDPVCQRLCQVPAFGPVVSSAFKSWIGDGCQFSKGRDAAAALGLVPRQHTSGDKQRLFGITKKGDKYMRTLIIHGSRSIAALAKKKDDPLSQWINGLIARRGFNKAVVALANKLARIAWAVVARGVDYQPRLC